MLGLLRLMSGRRLLIVAILAVLLLSGSAALRSGGARLLACGVSLQMGDRVPRVRDGLAPLASRCRPGSSIRGAAHP
jgi:hypothetical protein